MTDDLVTWLRAQLDEDQWFAEELSRGGNGGHITWAISRGRGVWMCTDYRRMLAEVEAKRRILDEHDTVGWKIGDRVHDCQWVNGWPCPTVRLLALPYAANPGFREEWAP